MKKLLIASSAIIGAGMLASTAVAANNITLGGSYTFTIDLGGNDNASDSMTFGGGSYSFYGSASKTTDSGLVLSGATHLDGNDADGGANWDTSTGSIAGDFGVVSFSNEGGSAVGMVSSGHGKSVSWNDAAGSGAGNAGGGAGIGAGEDSTVTYTSPNINGLTFGYTMAENGGNSEIDFEKESGSGADFSITDDGAGGHTSYTGLGVKYSTAGLTVGYASASSSTAITVKGSDAATDDGEYSTGWSGSKLSLGYATGPFAVTYSTVTKEADDVKTAGEATKVTDKGAIAAADTNETAIGVSYNYGAGTVSYVTSTEDVADPTVASGEEGKAEDVAATTLAVSHGLSNGITVRFEQHAGKAELDASKDGFETFSQNLITVSLNF